VKITGEQLDEMEAALMSAKLRITDEKINRAPEVQEWLRKCEEVQNQLWREFFHLARLGLWAEEYAIEALKSFKHMDPHGQADWALYTIPTPRPPSTPGAAPGAGSEGAGT